MINVSFVNKLKKSYKDKEQERFKIINLSNPLLHDSKRIIFALHRLEIEKAKKELIKIENYLKKLQKQLGAPRLEQEGSYKAAMEEYLEAKFFYSWQTGETINQIKDLQISHESYLGALSDLCGEIARYSINQAAKKNYSAVDKAYRDVSKILSYLTEFDFTAYLRTKYDQARGHLRKIEQINYDINIRK
jgi:predicted translin family RNA/ssDNA-binding protein